MQCTVCGVEMDPESRDPENSPMVFGDDFRMERASFICGSCAVIFSSYGVIIPCSRISPRVSFLALSKAGQYHITEHIQNGASCSECPACNHPLYGNGLETEHIQNSASCSEGQAGNHPQFSNGLETEKHILSYHGGRRDPRFQKPLGDRSRSFLTFGFELEMEGPNPDEYAGRIMESMNRREITLHFEEDISLERGRGMELITNPMTLDYMREEFMPKLGYWLSRLREDGYVSHNSQNCGLHVHIDRKGLGGQQVEKRLLYLVEKFKQELKRFSRRKSFKYCKFSSECDNEYCCHQPVQRESIAYVAEYCGHRCGERRLALNFCNGNTLEFRLFQGSLMPETIMAAVELCHSLAAMAFSYKQHDLEALSWGEYISIFTLGSAETGGRYNALQNYVDSNCPVYWPEIK